MTVITDPGLLARVDALQQAYAHALDRRDMEGWLACFASTGRYELTSAENVRLGLPVGMMLGDCHQRLRDRVKYVNEVWNHAVEHYLARHLLSRDLCAWSDDGSLAASNAVLGLRRSVGDTDPPRVTFTDPEVAAVGMEPGTGPPTSIIWPNMEVKPTRAP